MEKLKELMGLCKCGVYVTVNSHRDVYQTAAQAIAEARLCNQAIPDLPEDVEKVMVETDTIVSVQFYPDTPVGFYDVWHYDIDRAIDEALRIVREAA